MLDIRQNEGLDLPPETFFTLVSAPIRLLYGLGPIHNSTSKRIFGTREAFLDLLRCFVPENLLENANFSTLERQPETFITSLYGELRDDLVWRMKTDGEEWLFIYVLSEFQSKIDPNMAPRIDQYVGDLRMDLIRTGEIKRGDPLPMILPIVIYRGIPKWDAPFSITEMQGQKNNLLASFSEQQYLLIDIHRLAQESLENQKTIPEVFFQMERASSWEELKDVLQKACVYFKVEHYKDIRDMFLYWSKVVAIPRFTIPPDQIPNSNSLEELVGMSYVYDSKEEEEYYTKWRKDLVNNAENNGAKKKCIKFVKSLAADGVGIEKIMQYTELSRSDVTDILQNNS